VHELLQMGWAEKVRQKKGGDAGPDDTGAVYGCTSRDISITAEYVWTTHDTRKTDSLRDQ